MLSMRVPALFPLTRLTFLALTAVILFPAISSAAERGKKIGSPTTEDFARLQEEVWKLNKSQAETKEQLARMAEGMAQIRTLAETGSANQARLLARMDELVREVGFLSEYLSEGRMMRSGPPSSSYEPPATAPAPPPAATTAPAAAAASPETPAVAAPPSAAAAPAPTPAPAPPAPESLYQSAYADYSKGNYALALMGFEEFLQKYPRHKNAEDAHYFIGECHYAQRDFEKAIGAYDKLTERFPEGNKAPAALLKKGYSHLELYRIGQGVVTLQGLIQKYPHSPEAQLAKQKLQELGLSR